MSYAVFFDKDGETVRLPVNPESIKVSKSQKIENYDVLKLGGIAMPTGIELDKISFEAELPGRAYRYVNTSRGFKLPDFYLSKFETWRKSNEPVRFIKNNGLGDDLSILVLFDSLDIEETAGEEGDFMVSFELTEYRPFTKKEVVIVNETSQKSTVKIKPAARIGSPAIPNTYKVAAGDTLWELAWKYLGSGEKYTEILSMNPEIKNPEIIHVGQVIKLRD